MAISSLLPARSDIVIQKENCLWQIGKQLLLIPQRKISSRNNGPGEGINKIHSYRATKLIWEIYHWFSTYLMKEATWVTPLTMALNNSRNLKNTFDVKNFKWEIMDRDTGRYRSPGFKNITQAIACFVMFMIGAPLGAIIKKRWLRYACLDLNIFFII